MHKTFFAVAVTLALVGLASLGTASEHWEQDRELNYVGSWSPVYYTCDDSEGHLGSGYHAIGGGVFCGIITGRTVTVTVQDDVFDEPVVQFTCAWERETTMVIPPEVYGPVNDTVPVNVPNIGLIVTSTEHLADAAPSATFEVPTECLGSTRGDAPEGSTDIGVFPETHRPAGDDGPGVTCCSFTTGKVTLIYEN